jgi:beta-glucosidase
MTVSGFPDGFLWGTTSSSVGTEGAAPAADWIQWERSRQAQASGEGNGWATNYRDDAEVLASLGIDSVRVTVEWARLEPAPGRVDGQRVEHERRVLEAVRDAGLKPWITLHNSSLPGWFSEDEGGFGDDRARGYYWPRHVDRCAEWFEDLAAGWVPIEDPVGWALRAFYYGTRPPGRNAPDVARDAVIGALEANHAAWTILRGGDVPVMCVLDLPSPRRKPPPDPEAAMWWRVPWTTSTRALREGVIELPHGADIERPEMAGSFDLVGVAFVHAPKQLEPGERPTQDPARFDHEAAAAELSEAIRRLAEELPEKPLVVAAHGLGTTDDKQRESLLRATVDELRLAVRDGIDLRGYFHDTGIDGYDWNHGFTPRGLATRDRELKDSGHWLQELLT